MATYQEQIEKHKQSKVSKAMVAVAELNQIHEAMLILERDGIFTTQDRFLFCKAFVLKHPEINEALKEAVLP